MFSGSKITKFIFGSKWSETSRIQTKGQPMIDHCSISSPINLSLSLHCKKMDYNI
jgi:hypothetical protein